MWGICGDAEWCTWNGITGQTGCIGPLASAAHLAHHSISCGTFCIPTRYRKWGGLWPCELWCRRWTLALSLIGCRRVDGGGQKSVVSNEIREARWMRGRRVECPSRLLRHTWTSVDIATDIQLNSYWNYMNEFQTGMLSCKDMKGLCHKVKLISTGMQFNLETHYWTEWFVMPCSKQQHICHKSPQLLTHFSEKMYLIIGTPKKLWKRGMQFPFHFLRAAVTSLPFSPNPSKPVSCVNQQPAGLCPAVCVRQDFRTRLVAPFPAAASWNQPTVPRPQWDMHWP